MNAVRVPHVSLIRIPHLSNFTLKGCDNTNYGGVLSDANCESYSCPGNRSEFCGSQTALVLYQLQ